MVGDDHVEAELARMPNLVDGGDAAIDCQDETASLPGESLQRLAADAVALVEAARQMPFHVGAELAQHEQREHRGADAVDVVVAVDADALTRRDRRADLRNGHVHVAEQERIVQRQLAGEEGSRLLGVAVAAPDEHACRDLAEAKLPDEGACLPVRARTDGPDALRHARLRYEGCRTAPICAPSSSSTRV